jgi:hypothetical protein
MALSKDRTNRCSYCSQSCSRSVPTSNASNKACSQCSAIFSVAAKPSQKPIPRVFGRTGSTKNSGNEYASCPAIKELRRSQLKTPTGNVGTIRLRHLLGPPMTISSLKQLKPNVLGMITSSTLVPPAALPALIPQYYTNISNSGNRTGIRPLP